MSAAARLVTALARGARRIPVGEQTTSRLVGRIRTSTTARKVVSRVFDFETSINTSPVFLSSGKVLGGEGRDNLPVILVSLLGGSDRVVAARLEQLAQEQLLTAGFRPVVLIDADHFAAVREYGWPVEHLIGRNEWLGDPAEWDGYLTRRLRQLRIGYSARAMVDLVNEHSLGIQTLRSFELPY